MAKPKVVVAVKKDSPAKAAMKKAAAKSAVKGMLAKDMASDAKMASAIGGGRSTPGTNGLTFKSGGKVRK